MAFLTGYCPFSGPAQGVIDKGGGSELILPVTHGNCVVTVSENEHIVMFDETGETDRDAFSLGTNVEVAYPMKVDDMAAHAINIRNDQTTATTADPDSSGSLSTATAIQTRTGVPYKKTTFSFELTQVLNRVFAAADASAVTRTQDEDKFSLVMSACRRVNPSEYTFNIEGNSTYQLNLRGVLSSATGTLARFMNTDLAVS